MLSIQNSLCLPDGDETNDRGTAEDNALRDAIAQKMQAQNQ
jgi:hypothetical protein